MCVIRLISHTHTHTHTHTQTVQKEKNKSFFLLLKKRHYKVKFVACGLFVWCSDVDGQHEGRCLLHIVGGAVVTDLVTVLDRNESC